MTRDDGLGTPEVLGSVIIPAHNEAVVIRRCLDAVLAGFRPGELDVVVSCNACTDGTADIVRASGYPVRVVEIEVASKIKALRAAEQVLSVLPRLYLDADVVLTSTAARCVLECLRTGDVLAARPPIKYNADSAAALVCSYYRARSAIPAVMGSLWGAGVYGLSAAGRARFGDFPEVTNDDLFVDQQFQRGEVAIVDAPPVLVNVPQRTADLMRILRRVNQGNAENRAAFTEKSVEGAPAPSTVRDLVRLGLSRPTRLMDVAIYMTIAVLARASLIIAPATAWERDNSSRST
jgi:glycosyltransferase involved in cell wall biosynthesis